MNSSYEIRLTVRVGAASIGEAVTKLENAIADRTKVNAVVLSIDDAKEAKERR